MMHRRLFVIAVVFLETGSCENTYLSLGVSYGCILKQSDSTADCWGANNDKQSTPPTPLVPYSSIAAGGYHTCGLKQSDSTPDCWGRNAYKQSTPPTPLVPYSSIAAGKDHTCGLKQSDGTADCWGRNHKGQATPPTPLVAYSSIACGSSFACAVKQSDSTTDCWGAGSDDTRSGGGGWGAPTYSYDDDQSAPSVVSGARVASAPLGPSLTNDPHAVGGHGGKFDFAGKNNTYFNLLSHTNLSVVALFSLAAYVDDHHRKVFGSYMTKAFATALTTSGTTLNISYEAGALQPEHAKIAWVKEGREVLTNELKEGEVTEGNVQVKVTPTTEGAKVIVTQLGRWGIHLSSAQYFDESNGDKRKMHRVDVNVRPLTTAVEHEAVAPHGIIGQTFDGDNLAISGAQDDYNKSVVVTSAQGEGAIEGSGEDYVVSSPFATSFKYDRFAAKAAPPRDITKLTGKVALRATNDAKAEVWA